MITGDPKIDKKYPDRVRILQDKRNGFLLVDHPTKEEEEMADVFKLAFERFVVVLKSKEEMKTYIRGFEKEARLKLSKDKKEDIFKAWETYQKELVIF